VEVSLKNSHELNELILEVKVLRGVVDQITQITRALGYQQCDGRIGPVGGWGPCRTVLGPHLQPGFSVLGKRYCRECLHWWWNVEAPELPDSHYERGLKDLVAAIASMDSIPVWAMKDNDLAPLVMKKQHKSRGGKK